MERSRFNPSVRRTPESRPLSGAWRWQGKMPGAMRRYGWEYRGSPRERPRMDRPGQPPSRPGWPDRGRWGSPRDRERAERPEDVGPRRRSRYDRGYRRRQRWR